MLQTILDSVPKDSQSLCDIVLGIEKNTGLNFPSQVRKKLRIEYSDISDMYEIASEVYRNIYGRELDEEGKADIKRECESQNDKNGRIFGIADCRNYKVHLFVENIMKGPYVNAANKFTKLTKEEVVSMIIPLITVHELSHILLHHLIPDVSVKYQILEGVNLDKLIDLDELFADSIMSLYYGGMHMKLSDKHRFIVGGYIEEKKGDKGRKMFIEAICSFGNLLEYVEDTLKGS